MQLQNKILIDFILLIKWIFRKVDLLIIPMFRIPYKFAPKEVEKEFLTDYALRFANSRRAGIILGLCVWTLYVAWDIYHGINSEVFRPYLENILILRFIGVIILVIIAIFVFRSKKNQDTTTTVAISTGVISVYFLLLIMINISPFPYNYLFYFIGLPLVLVFIYSLMRLRAQPVFIITTIILFVSCISLRYAARNDGIKEIDALDSYYYVAAMTYLMSFAVVGTAVCIELERSARKAFSRERKILESSKKIEEKNNQLEELSRETQAKTQALIDLKDQLRVLAEERAAAAAKFLADAAHDLRQPIHALGNLLAAAQHALSNKDIEKCSEIISLAEGATKTTGSSFNSILDISGLESGFVKPNYSSFYLQDMFDDVLSTFLIIGREQQVDIRIRKSAYSKAVIRSDYALLSRALSNIISNSIKYKTNDLSKNPTVVVGFVCFSNRVRIDVIDNGLGIHFSQWKNVFKPFVQLDNPNKDQRKGRGLGLSIVDAVVNLLHDHRVDMISVVGKGTRFSITAPLSDIACVVPVKSDASENIDGFNFSDFYVLYIEDDLLVGKSTSELLNIIGVKFDHFDSYESMESNIETIVRIPDIILSDFRLPNDKNSYDVVRRINEEFDVEVPLLVVTAEISLDVDIFKYNKSFMLYKPIGPNELISKLKSILSLT